MPQDTDEDGIDYLQLDELEEPEKSSKQVDDGFSLTEVKGFEPGQFELDMSLAPSF